MLSVIMLMTVSDVGLYAGTVCVVAALVGMLLEQSSWQLPDRAATGLVLILLAVFLTLWIYGSDVFSITGTLSEYDLLVLLVLVGASIKVLQVKRRRDWVFIYLLSFFHVLLATSTVFGLLQSLLLLVYSASGLTTLLCFANQDSRVEVPQSGSVDSKSSVLRVLPARRIIGVVVCLVALIFVLAVPIFLLTPRLERTARARVRGGAGGLVGFSGRLALGQIGSLQQSDDLVMRVRLDDASKTAAMLRWRGSAFDNFDGREWRRTEMASQLAASQRPDFFDLGGARGMVRPTGQTVILEPLDTQVLFAAPRVIAIEGSLPYVLVDSEGGLTSSAHTTERIVYRAHSDFSTPAVEELRVDRRAYPDRAERYLHLPAIDPRLARLATEIARSAAPTRYDFAVAVERYLRENYRYSLDMRARGDDPLADFLFGVRAGHCEYFASAMAVMLRTQGIATRVVNGFQAGRYNSKADAYIVRQRDAHAWVEVYFPATDAWVAFDPTPYAEHPGNTAEASSAFDEYAEALGLLWTQYVSSYGRQEQRALVSGLRSAADNMIAGASGMIDGTHALWRSALTMFRGEGAGADRRHSRIPTVAIVISGLSAAALLMMLVKQLTRLRRLRRENVAASATSEVIDESPMFYKRMLELLSVRKRNRELFETPHEFAASIRSPDVGMLTDAYHRVRYGGEMLTGSERESIEAGLRRLAENEDSDARAVSQA